MYIFAYGSLMNPRSLAKSLPGERVLRKTLLRGYRRKANIEFDDYAYMNLVEEASAIVLGYLIPVDEAELLAFAEREEGYALTDVSARIADDTTDRIVAFIAPDKPCEKPVPRSYLMTCTSGMTETERATWIAETEILAIEEDLASPIYEFVSE